MLCNLCNSCNSNIRIHLWGHNHNSCLNETTITDVLLHLKCNFFGLKCNEFKEE
jgi:hypothetical protein